MMWPFYVMAVVAIFSTIRVITNSNPVHALLSLIVSLLAVAGIFLMAGSPFAAALEVIVYAGAIMVLFVFVVMMLNLGSHTVMQEKSWLTSAAWAWPMALSAVLAVVLVWMLGHTDNTMTIGRRMIGPKDVGFAMFTHYVILVEVAGMLLLGALVSAYHLAKRSLQSGDQE